MTMHEMAEEYLQNAQRLEARIKELQEQITNTGSLTVRQNLHRRINALQTMLCETRKTAFELEHYYDKPEENPVYEQHKTKSKAKKKFSRHGYGAATPALATHSGKPNEPPVSSIRASFSRRDAAKGDCTGV